MGAGAGGDRQEDDRGARRRRPLPVGWPKRVTGEEGEEEETVGLLKKCLLEQGWLCVVEKTGYKQTF